MMEPITEAELATWEHITRDPDVRAKQAAETIGRLIAEVRRQKTLLVHFFANAPTCYWPEGGVEWLEQNIAKALRPPG